MPAAGQSYESPNDPSEWIPNAAALLPDWTQQTQQLVQAIKHWAALCAPSQLPAGGALFYTVEDRFGLVQQLLAVLVQRAILPRELVGSILHQFPAALVKILALLYQLLTSVDQVIRDFFSLAD
jgi:hypothetical protein